MFHLTPSSQVFNPPLEDLQHSMTWNRSYKEGTKKFTATGFRIFTIHSEFTEIIAKLEELTSILFDKFRQEKVNQVSEVSPELVNTNPAIPQHGPTIYDSEF